jgi:hypothetical protein
VPEVPQDANRDGIKNEEGWLDLKKTASVEVSSEDENHPIEFALLGDEKRGWRAAGPGSQTLRLIFDSPQRLKRIWLAFEDSEAFRTQEFVLRWSSHVGQPLREIVRQQWNFSSPGAVREIEDYAVELVDGDEAELGSPLSVYLTPTGLLMEGVYSH